MSRASKVCTIVFLFVTSTRLLSAQNQNPIATKAPIPSHIVAMALTPRGFEPPALTIVEGNVFFSVYNRTRWPDVNLQVDRAAAGPATSQRLKNTLLPRSKKAWREIIELSPGKYTITVAEMPNWQFELTVRAK